MYKTTTTKITPVYKPKNIGLESGAEEAEVAPVMMKKKPKGTTDKAWALLNLEGGAKAKGIDDMPRIGKNKA